VVDVVVGSVVVVDVVVLDVEDVLVLDDVDEDVLVLDVEDVVVVVDADVVDVLVVVVLVVDVLDVEVLDVEVLDVDVVAGAELDVLDDDVAGGVEVLVEELLEVEVLELVLDDVDVVLLDVELVELLVVVVVVVGRHAPVFTSRRHWLNVPPSASASSEIVSVQTPFGFSPTNAASGSSGTSGVAGPLAPQLRSVTRPLFDVYGTWPLGFAPSFQSVPLNALLVPGALSVVSVTIVPPGDVSVMSRSSL
jgi:hypothetical protein